MKCHLQIAEFIEFGLGYQIPFYKKGSRPEGMICLRIITTVQALVFPYSEDRTDYRQERCDLKYLNLKTDNNLQL